LLLGANAIDHPQQKQVLLITIASRCGQSRADLAVTRLRVPRCGRPRQDQ